MMPASLRSAVDLSELETAPLNKCLYAFNSSIKKLTVVPVPMPRIISEDNFLCKNSIACLATFIFEPLMQL